LRTQTQAELTEAEVETLRSEFHELSNSVWNMEEFPQQCKVSIIVPIYKKDDQTDCNIYRHMIVLSTTYKILSNIPLSRLSPYIDKIIGDHQCGFRRNRSTTD
jgi:hypothetical protein